MTKTNCVSVAAVVLVCAACSPIYYVPNTLNVPMVHAKGQANVTLAGNGNQVEFQGAKGVGDSVALQVNFGFLDANDEENGSGGSGKLLEAGLGYFRNVKPDVLFDVYALVGVGSVENHFPDTVSASPGTTGKIAADMSRFGVQPSISWHRKYFSVSGSARLSNLRYRNVEGDLIFNDVNEVDYLNDNKSHFLFEPALTLRVGSERIRVQVQVVRSVNLSHSSFKQEDDLVTVGFNYKFR